MNAESRPQPVTAAIIESLRAAGCVFAEEEAALLASAAHSGTQLAAMLARRVQGVPLEQVIGWAEVGGVRVAVSPGVFVPRHRSTLLVAEAARRTRPGAVVVDLCCGTGALGLAVAAAVGPVELHAADIDPAASRCARRNVAAIGGRVYTGDLFDALPRRLRGRVDLLVANVPYVPTAALHLLPREARLYEPPLALDGGPDGLDMVRRLATGAPHWLSPTGHVLVEVSEDQVVDGLRIVAEAGLRATVARDEDLEATVVVGGARAWADACPDVVIDEVS